MMVLTEFSRLLKKGGGTWILAFAEMTTRGNAPFFVIPAKAGTQSAAIGVFFNRLLSAQ